MSINCRRIGGNEPVCLPAQLPIIVDGLDDPYRLAARRAGSLVARKRVTAAAAWKSQGVVGLLHLHRFLERVDRVADMVVDVPRVLDLGRLPHDALSVLACVAKSHG